MKATNLSKRIVIVEKLQIADNFWQRLKGLIGKKEFKDGEGLYLTPCSSVHSFWMRFPIDVVYLDKESKVIYIIENMKPCQMGKVIKRAASVLELPTNTIKNSGTSINDKLLIERVKA